MAKKADRSSRTDKPGRLDPQAMTRRVETAHMRTHRDHPDPARELRRLIKAGPLKARTWKASKGMRWELSREPSEEEDGAFVWALTLLDKDYCLVCQASVAEVLREA